MVFIPKNTVVSPESEDGQSPLETIDGQKMQQGSERWPKFSALFLELNSLYPPRFIKQDEDVYEMLEHVFGWAIDLIKEAKGAGLCVFYSKKHQAWVFYCEGEVDSLLSAMWGIHLSRVYPRQKFYSEIRDNWQTLKLVTPPAS